MTSCPVSRSNWLRNGKPLFVILRTQLIACVLWRLHRECLISFWESWRRGLTSWWPCRRGLSQNFLPCSKGTRTKIWDFVTISWAESLTSCLVSRSNWLRNGKQWFVILRMHRQRQVEKFLLMLKRRSADLRTLCAESFQQLFPTGNTQDADFRFGYDFRCRVCPKLRAEDLEHVNTGLESVLVTRTTAKEKPGHLPRLHAEEFEMDDDLPRPRLPKSLRQLYGGSVGAESRIMPFFHRVHEVDSFLLGHDFQACDYCKEGWFGTQRGKADLPGKFESTTYQKCNFVLAPEKNWLSSGKPICVHCLAEAKARAKDGLPLEPFRLTAANYADVGDALPETDALTFFEEEILSPIQHIVRIFTLHSTGQTELRGHVGNLFQNGPQYVRQIPAVVGDMKMLLVRRCPKDPNRKQRVPFLASRLRLQRALDRLARPVAEGGSLALQPGALTPEGYVGLVCRENLEQFEATEEGAEPSGLQVHVVDQKFLDRLDYNLFTMWLVCQRKFGRYFRVTKSWGEVRLEGGRKQRWCQLDVMSIRKWQQRDVKSVVVKTAQVVN